MKTVIDAVKYYGGYHFVNGKLEGHHTHIVSAIGDDRFYSAYASDIGGDSAVCTIQEFNKCVDMLIGDPLKLIIWKESKKPKKVYTAAMCEANELPSVGMECMVVDSSLMNHEYEKCNILFVGVYKVVYTSESCIERFSNLDEVKFKPIDTRTDDEKTSDDIFNLTLEVPTWRKKSEVIVAAIKAGKIHNVTWGK